MALDPEEVGAADDRLQLLIECLPPPPAEWEALPLKRDVAAKGAWCREERPGLLSLAALHDASGLGEAEEFIWRMMQIRDVRPRPLHPPYNATPLTNATPPHAPPFTCRKVLPRLRALRFLHFTLDGQLRRHRSLLRLVTQASHQAATPSTSHGLQPYAPILQPDAPILQPHAPSLQPYAPSQAVASASHGAMAAILTRVLALGNLINGGHKVRRRITPSHGPTLPLIQAPPDSSRHPPAVPPSATHPLPGR